MAGIYWMPATINNSMMCLKKLFSGIDFGTNGPVFMCTAKDVYKEGKNMYIYVIGEDLDEAGYYNSVNMVEYIRNNRIGDIDITSFGVITHDYPSITPWSADHFKKELEKIKKADLVICIVTPDSDKFTKYRLAYAESVCSTPIIYIPVEGCDDK